MGEGTNERGHFGVRMCLSAWLLGALMAVPAYGDPDPFEGINRPVQTLNDGLDKMLLRPAAKTYQTVLPGFV